MVQVIQVIDDEAVPLLKRCSLAGHAQLKTSNPIFGEHPQAADMLIDILTDRGFSVAHTMDERIVPVRAMQGACVRLCIHAFPSTEDASVAQDLTSRLARCRRD